MPWLRNSLGSKSKGDGKEDIVQEDTLPALGASSRKNEHPRPRVLIVGAGLGGLALAQALRRKGISFKIFERDPDAGRRPQGWAILLGWILKDMLSSFPRTMQPLENFSVTKEIEKTMRATFWSAENKNPAEMVAVRLGQDEKGNDISLRVNRIKFRNWLATDIDVTWNKQFTHYEEKEDRVVVHFMDGTSAEGDILVGADGISSKVRAQLLAPNPPELNINPIAMISGETRLTKEQYERQMAIATSFYIVFEGTYRVFIGLRDIAADLQSAKYYWQYTWRDEEIKDPESHWTYTSGQKQQLDFVLENTKNFDPRFREVIELTKPEEVLERPILVRDMEPPESLPNGRLTLIGDAIGPMTFFRGEGANHAVQDGLHLARRIDEGLAMSEGIRQGRVWDAETTLKEYEGEMLGRKREAVLASREAALDLSTPRVAFIVKAEEEKKEG
ncbi:hypothetical protein MMC25_004066 [Agyrium rufum]|nr:hypothetical protein [Agyrium rufum]